MKFLKNITIIILISISFTGLAQEKYFTRTGHVYFLSHTPVIDIDGNNHQAVSFLNVETGEMVFAVLMQAFEFTLATAEEHFNESYAESHKFPKSKFKGKIQNLDEVDFDTPGTYNVVVEGDLTIHGETNKVKEKGTLTVKSGTIIGESEFTILIEDYKIKVPRVVSDKVAKEVVIKIKVEYQPYDR